MPKSVTTNELIDECLRRLSQAQIHLLKARNTVDAHHLHRLNDARTLVSWTFRDLDDKVTEIWGQIIYDLEEDA